MLTLTADAPQGSLAPTSIAALVKIRAAVRRLRRKDHASVTLHVDADAGTATAMEAVETYQLKDGQDEHEFLALVWSKYRTGGHTAIGFSVHDGRLTARLSMSRSDEQIRLLTEQLAHVSMQLAAFNHFLEYARAHGFQGEAEGAYELRGREFAGE